jgi:hypothetical protein
LTTPDDPAAEPSAVMAEAALLLCHREPRTLTGRIAYSQELLDEFGVPVPRLQADRSAELLPDLGVLHRDVERALRTAGLLGRERDGRHVEDMIEHGPGGALLADQPGWRVVERQLADPRQRRPFGQEAAD